MAEVIDTMMKYLPQVEDEMEDDDVQLLARLFKSPMFRSLLKVEKYVREAQEDAPRPHTLRALKEVEEVCCLLQRSEKNRSLKNALYNLLQDPSFKAFLAAHDIIAAEELIPRKAKLTKEDQNNLRIVEIEKSPGEPLGATIRRNDFTSGVVISRVLHGGAAYRTGRLKPGDEICEINGCSVDELSLDGVVTLLNLETGSITFKILPSEESPGTVATEQKMFIRVYFDYDPYEDPHIPCKEAGLDFQKRDILEIIDKNEPKWWQAKRVGGKHQKIGIIPSKNLQERRLALRLWTPQTSFKDVSDISIGSSSLSKNLSDTFNSTLNSSSSSKFGISPEKAKKRKRKKVKYEAGKSDRFHTEEVMIYEEVIQVIPESNKPRPVVLIGASQVCCNDMKRKLLETNNEKFDTPTPCTTRPKKSLEREGRDYHYISRKQMEEEIQNNEYIEYEAMKGHMTGISLKSVLDIRDSGKICIVSLKAQSLRTISRTQLNPQILFIKSPSLEQLQLTRLMAEDHQVPWESSFTDEELLELVSESNEIEAAYGHYFDSTFVNNDFETTLNQIYHSIMKTSLEPHWTPIR